PAAPRLCRYASCRPQLRMAERGLGRIGRSERQLYGCGGAAMMRLGVGLDPRDAAELDAFLGQGLRFVVARFAIDAVRIDLAVMNAARLLGKALADVIAIGLDLAAHLRKRGEHLSRRDWRLIARASDIGRHQRLLDLRIAAIRTGDLARLLLRLKPVAVAEPALEFMAGSASQREQDHRADLLTHLSITEPRPKPTLSEQS